MKNQIAKLKNAWLLAAAMCGLLAFANRASAQGTSFTYQGQLVQSNVAASGNFDFRFGLYTNVSLGSPVGSLETNLDVAVSNGLFLTTLNFSNAFNGTAYWLEIGVRTNGSTNAFTILSPRQPVTPTPYAITASNLTGTLSASQLTGPLPDSVLSGTYTNSLSLTNTNNLFAGNGLGLTNVPVPTQTNYLYLYDTTVQYIATANSYQYVSFSTVGNSNGWTFPTSSEFTVNQTGLYQVTYHILMQNLFSSPVTAATRAVLNGSSEILSSETVVSIPASDGIVALDRTFLMQLTAGQSFSLQVTANGASNDVYLVAGSFPPGQSFPSASLTVIRIQ